MDQTVALTPDTQPAETVAARDLRPGQIVAWGRDGLAYAEVAHTELSDDAESVLVVTAGAFCWRHGADDLLVLAPADRYQAQQAQLRAKRVRLRTLAALRTLAEHVERGMPLPAHGLSIAGSYGSADEVAEAARFLGEPVRQETHGPAVYRTFVVGEFDPVVFVRFNAYTAPKAAPADATSGALADPSGSAYVAAPTDEPAVEAPDLVGAVRMAVSVAEVRAAEQADAEANCDGCADVRLSRGWRDDATGLTSGPVVDEFRPHTCGREV